MNINEKIRTKINHIRYNHLWEIIERQVHISDENLIKRSISSPVWNSIRTVWMQIDHFQTL